MMEGVLLIFFGLLAHLPCLLAVGACGIGCKVCAAKHRLKFILTGVVLTGLYLGAHFYEHQDGDPAGSPNYFFCGS